MHGIRLLPFSFNRARQHGRECDTKSIEPLCNETGTGGCGHISGNKSVQGFELRPHPRQLKPLGRSGRFTVSSRGFDLFPIHPAKAIEDLDRHLMGLFQPIDIVVLFSDERGDTTVIADPTCQQKELLDPGLGGLGPVHEITGPIEAPNDNDRGAHCHRCRGGEEDDDFEAQRSP